MTIRSAPLWARFRMASVFSSSSSSRRRIIVRASLAYAVLPSCVDSLLCFCLAGRAISASCVEGPGLGICINLSPALVDECIKAECDTFQLQSGSLFHRSSTDPGIGCLSHRKRLCCTSGTTQGYCPDRPSLCVGCEGWRAHD